MSKNPVKKGVFVRTYPEVRDRLKKYAIDNGLSVSDFLVNSACFRAAGGYEGLAEYAVDDVLRTLGEAIKTDEAMDEATKGYMLGYLNAMGRVYQKHLSRKIKLIVEAFDEEFKGWTGTEPEAEDIVEYLREVITNDNKAG